MSSPGHGNVGLGGAGGGGAGDRNARFRTSAVFAVGMLFLLLMVAIGLIWIRLPDILQRHALARLAAAGFAESSLRLRSVGIHRLELAGFALTNGPWHIQLEEGAARYQPFELLRPEIRSVHLDGLRIDLDWLSHLASPPADGMAYRTSRLMAVDTSARFPIRSLSVCNGLFRIHHGATEILIPFALHLTNHPESGRLHLEFQGRVGHGTIRMTALVGPETGGHVALDLDLIEPDLWLALLLPPGHPADLRGLRVDPFHVTLELRMPPDQDAIELDARIPVIRLRAQEGDWQLANLGCSARWADHGLMDLMINTVVSEWFHAGWGGSAEQVSVRLSGTDSLRATFENTRFSGPNAFTAEGDFNLTINQPGLWPDADGMIDVLLHGLEFAGLTTDPFHAKIQGTPGHIDFVIGEITAQQVNAGRFRLTSLQGAVADPFTPELAAALGGNLHMMASPFIMIPDPVGFELAAQRRGEAMFARLHLDFNKTALHLPESPEHLELTGSASTSVLLQTNGSEWQTHFDLELGTVSLDRIEGLQVSKPRLRLHRPAVKGPEQDSLAQFEFEADSAVYQGIRVEHPRAFGEIWIDAVRLRGAADLEGECFEYGIDLQPAWSWLTGPKLAGQFELGPVRLRAFDIPTHLTAGNPIRMSGDIEVNGGFRMVPGERLALWPQIRLGLEEMEMVAHQVIATAVDGAIGWGPLKDRGQGSDGRVQIARIGYRDHELTDVCIQVGRVADDAVTIQLTHARFLGGQIRSGPVRWCFPTGDFDLVLDMQDVSLSELAQHVPQFVGSIEGSLHGHLSVQRRAGTYAIAGGRLELDPSVPARIQYPADGLLTTGWPRGSDEYRRLHLVEEGLKDLRLKALTVHLHDPGDVETSIRARLEGTSISERAIVPIIFHLNIVGDLDELFRLMNLGEIQIVTDP